MSLTAGNVLALVGVGIVTYIIGVLIYNTAFHPLRNFPGPLLWRSSRLPFLFHMLRGDLPHRAKSFHDMYGECVRVAPNELSFINGWKDIYSKEYLDRPAEWRIPPQPAVGAYDLTNSIVATHARFRRAILPGFNKKSNVLQHTLVDLYGGLLVEKLNDIVAAKNSTGSGKGNDNRASKTGDAAVINLVEWISYAAFDLTTDLGWGRNMNCLETGVFQPWMTVITQYRAALVCVACNYFPPLNKLLDMLTPPSALAAVRAVIDIARNNVDYRLTHPTNRADLMAPILEHNKVSPEKALSIAEIISNSTVFVLGGTEPTTLAIVGTIQELLTHPSCMQRLCGEIRAAFATGDAITAESTKALPYLDAVLKEGLRMWPPFPDGLRRVLMPHGATIAGRFVPGGSTVSSSCWCTFSSETYFAEPDVFAPQRWMENSERKDRVGKFTHDRKDVFHPFALGPRNCPAQALAWAQMKVFLAKLLWNFDVRIKDGKTKIVPSKRQRIFWHWQHLTLDVEIVKR